MNKLTMKGVLTRDAELKYSPSGVAVTRINFSITEGKDKKRTDYFNAVAFYDLAEELANNYRKGDTISFEGKLQNNNYEKDGKKVYSDRIIIENFIQESVKGKQIAPTLDDDLPF